MKMNRKRKKDCWSSAWLFTIVILMSCSQTDTKEVVPVNSAGALKNFMHHNDITGKVSLDTLNPVDLYALGALENLKGELIIIDGLPYLSREENGKLVIEKTYNARASLLVYSYVSAWNEHKIRESANSLGELESLVEEIAIKEGLNIEKPFPFMLKGRTDLFKWHVINWPEEDSLHTHQKHIESGLNGIEENREVTILGFYSRHHQGIYTHHTSHMHLHFLSDDLTLAGHVDQLIPGSNFKILLPSID